MCFYNKITNSHISLKLRRIHPHPCGAAVPMDGVFYAYYEYGFWEMTGNKKDR